jgi:hypothetical protein
LVQFDRLPEVERREFLEDVKADDARLVGEAVLDPQKYLKSSDEIRATVDRFKEWLEANKKIGTLRLARRQRRASR